MTKGELIKELEKYTDDMEVVVWDGESYTEIGTVMQKDCTKKNEYKDESFIEEKDAVIKFLMGLLK